MKQALEQALEQAVGGLPATGRLVDRHNAVSDLDKYLAQLQFRSLKD
jgi:hypothetical protein